MLELKDIMKRGTPILSKNETVTIKDYKYVRISNNVTVEATKDPKLMRVYESKHSIGSVRNEKDYWVVYGVFIETHFNTMEDAVDALVARWDYHLAKVLSERDGLK